MTGQPVIRLRLFGRFSAVGDGVPPLPLRIASRKGIALLAYLTLHPEHTVSREKLATLLWGDRPDQQARLNLRQCMLSLRNALAPATSNLFILDGDAIGLRMEALGVDALEFQNLAASTEACDLERAAGLYSAALLGDLSIESEEFDAWLRATRARFEADFARLLDRLIDQRDAAGQNELAIGAAEKLAAIDPLREDWQRRLLRMLARHDSGTAALSRARTFTALLRRELDVDPEPATAALIEQIQRGEIGPASREVPLTSLPEAIAMIEPVATDAPPIVVPDDALPSFAAGRARFAQLPPAARRWQLHPAVSTSLIVFATFSVTVGLMFLAGAYFMPRLIPIWANQAARANMAVALPEKSPIVVLPFEAGAGTDSAGIAEQVSNDVIDSLSHVPNLKVISRLTSRDLTQQDKDIAAIGAKLGVRYALHGSVQTDAEKLHVNVELIDIASRLQVWSHRFDENQSDRSSASDAIAQQLGRALQVEVINFQADHVSPNAPPAKAEVDQFVAKGWAILMNRPNGDGLDRAETLFNEALQRDPERLGAMLGLAAHHTWAAPMSPPERRDRMRAEAKDLLTRVIARRPDWSPPYYYLGMLIDMGGDPEAGLETLQKCVTLNPSFAPGYAQIGRVLTQLGKPEIGLENINRAMTLSPNDPAFPAWLVFAGLAEIERGHDAAALDLISRATALQPSDAFFQASLASVYALSGDWRNADVHAAKYRELTPTLTNEQRVASFAGRWQPKRFATGARLALASAAQ